MPTEVEKKGFRVRVQHSSSMVFNSRTKLPMQSSPVSSDHVVALPQFYMVMMVMVMSCHVDLEIDL